MKFALLRTAGGSRPPHLDARVVMLGGFGGFLGIGTLALLGTNLDVMLTCPAIFGPVET